MRTQMINFATITCVAALFVFTSCSKDSLVQDIAPQDPWQSESLNDQNTYEYEVLSADLQYLHAITETTINRQQLEGYTYEGGGESDEGANAKHKLWAYSVGGHDTLSIDKIGKVSLDFNIKTNPYTRSATGELVVQSMVDKHSVMKYQITGSDKINEMTSQKGYEIGLTLTSADGGFVQAARSGSATLSTQEAGLDGQLFTQIDIYLNNE